MKILIDENLPVVLEELFREFADAIHVNHLKSYSRQRIKDHQLRRLALFKDYVIITRDDDFVRSWVSRKAPEKVIFVSIEGKKEKILNGIIPYLSLLVELIHQFDFIELNKFGMRLPFENQLPYR